MNKEFTVLKNTIKVGLKNPVTFLHMTDTHITRNDPTGWREGAFDMYPGSCEIFWAQAVEYASQLGLAFQIRDDMLDVMGDESVFGKPIGSDREEGKVTFVDLRGLDGCAALVDQCTSRAKAAIADWDDCEFLLELADQMIGRTK